jgi:hypothetical protein
MLDFVMTIFASVGIYTTTKTFVNWCKTVKKEFSE